MKGKTYYMILGVPSTETDSGIRAAYRDLAKRFHPDVAGEHATRSFQEISEAYSVLSDPQRRREYNRELRSGDASSGAVSVRRSPREPLVSASVPIFRGRDGVRTAFDVRYQRPKRLMELDVEVLLTPGEASTGCVVPVEVPVFSPCPQCGGSGRDGWFPCGTCQEQGMIENQQLLRIQMPRRIRSGSIYEIALRGLGAQDFNLRLHVFVEAWPG
jgi:DnaJ-class molecular chaperone